MVYTKVYPSSEHIIHFIILQLSHHSSRFHLVFMELAGSSITDVDLNCFMSTEHNTSWSGLPNLLTFSFVWNTLTPKIAHKFYCLYHAQEMVITCMQLFFVSCTLTLTFLNLHICVNHAKGRTTGVPSYTTACENYGWPVAKKEEQTKPLAQTYQPQNQDSLDKTLNFPWFLRISLDPCMYCWFLWHTFSIFCTKMSNNIAFEVVERYKDCMPSKC